MPVVGSGLCGSGGGTWERDGMGVQARLGVGQAEVLVGGELIGGALVAVALFGAVQLGLSALLSVFPLLALCRERIGGVIAHGAVGVHAAPIDVLVYALLDCAQVYVWTGRRVAEDAR